MTPAVWRGEVLRLTRTHRLLVLLCLQTALGVTGPLLARYAEQLFSGLSGSSNVRITVAAARPADGMLGFYRSAMQVGLVATIAVAGLAACVDASPASAVFYRTRASMPRVLVPRYVVTAAAVVGAYSIGFAVAWYETVTLLGTPPVSPTVQLWLLGAAYTAFAATLTFTVSAFFRGVAASVGAAVVVVLLLPTLGNLPSIARFVPSWLTQLPTDAYRGSPHPSPVAALATIGVVTAAGLLGMLHLLARRQLR